MERDKLEEMGFEENENGIWKCEGEEFKIEIVKEYVRIEEYDRMDGCNVIWLEFRNGVEIMEWLENECFWVGGGESDEN